MIFFTGITIAGMAIRAEFIGDFLLALILGIFFQYFAIAPMRGLNFKEGIKAAGKADFFSLLVFEVGLFIWMALMAFVSFPGGVMMPNSPVYWFMMQIGMVIGFVTAYPANAVLVNKGVKSGM